MRVHSIRFWCVAVLVGSLLFSSRSFAQSSENSVQDAAQTEQKSTANASSKPAEAAEDETAQFKHSASVKLLSRITGLSLEAAYWLAVMLNFAIVVGFIAWAAKKNLPAVF